MEIIDEARDICDRLIVAARESRCKHRGEVSSRAKWLLNALTKWEIELGGGTFVSDPGPTDAEIEARIVEARARKRS